MVHDDGYHYERVTTLDEEVEQAISTGLTLRALDPGSILTPDEYEAMFS